MAAEKIEAFDSKSRQVDVLPDSSFSLEKVGQVVATLSTPDLVDAMLGANPSLPEEQANQIVEGEKRRIAGVSPASHPEFYGKPLSLLIDTGVLVSGYSVVEPGPSFMAHYPAMSEHIRPGKVVGIEHYVTRHIAAAANVAVDGYKKARLLPGDADYKVVVLDGNSTEKLPGADIAVASLLGQYAGADAVLDFVSQDGDKPKILVNGDYVHRPQEISNELLAKGILPITTADGEPTGFAWRLGRRLSETKMGTVYEAEWVAIGDVFGNDRNQLLSLPRDVHTTRLIVFEENGQLKAEGWGFIPKSEATDEDIDIIVTTRTTIHDIWGHIGQVTNGAQNWDGNGSLRLPILAAEKGLHTLTRLTTGAPIPGPLPIVILKRNAREAGLADAAGLLSLVGQDKKYPTLDDLYQMVNSALASGVHTKFELVPPPHLSTISSTDPSVIQKILG